MNTVVNLWNGRAGLAKTYWLWGVLSGIPFGLALSLVTPGSKLAILAVLAFVTYYVIVHVGLWRAASQYQGPKTWAILAKLAVVITPACIVIGTLAAIIILAIQQYSPVNTTPAQSQPRSNRGKSFSYEEAVKAPVSKKPFSYEEAVGTPAPTKPPNLESRGWTQETTGSSVSGPWLNFDAVGTRYSRNADGIIYRYFPPGIRPEAEEANPFGLDVSSDRVPQ